MPVSPTYPGVYVEEVPSGVRTIVGVPTSVTAFIGRAERGPVDDPVVINNWGDFERRFGGLQVDYPMSYAVQDFFLNGGSQAVIVRLCKGASTATLAAGDFKVAAVNPGTWGNALEVTVDVNGIDDEVAKRYGLTQTDLFNLTVVELGPDGLPKAREQIRNVSVKEGARRVDRVLEQESRLIRMAPGVTLPGTTIPGTGKMTNDKAGQDSEALDQTAYTGEQTKKTGLYALEKTDIFNLLCIPPDTRSGTLPAAVYQTALSYCALRRAMLIVDPPDGWQGDDFLSNARTRLGELGLGGTAARNAALYFPRVIQADPLREGQLDTFVPCGIVAGVMARTDRERGVWKAPAGQDAAINGVQGLTAVLTDDENGQLNPLGINCLRSFPIVGRVVWGARTLRGADQLADEYKYIPVRRLALFIEETLYRNLKWVVFEPNDEPLWGQIRLNVGAFMQTLFRQGAFQGKTPQEAYFVKCDKETTTQNDINLGIVNIVVGFAPLKPAEFVIIKIQQLAGQIQA